MTCIMPKKVAQAEKVLNKENLSLANFHLKYDTTEKRVEFLTQQFNSKPEAEFFNRKFERFILTNQKDRLKAWAKKSAKEGINTDTTKTLLDKIDKLSKPLQGRNYNALDNKSKQLLNGLVEQKLGFGLNKDELKSIISANSNIQQYKKALEEKFPDYKTWGTTSEGQKKYYDEFNKELKEWEKNPDNPGVIIQYGLSVLKMKKIYDEAKIGADKNKRIEKFGKPIEVISALASGLKSMKATFDASFGRQLSSALMGYKGAWNGEKEGLSVFFKYFTGGAKLTEQQINTLDLMVITRPNAVNGNYNKLGVAVGIQEEAYPTAIERIFGDKKNDKESTGTRNIFKVSELAYTSALQVARANIADEFIINANGDVGLLKEQGAGDFVNMITGRGKGLKDETVMHMFNTLMFSPRWLSSRLQLVFDLRKVPYLFDKTGRHVVDRARGWAAIKQAAWVVVFAGLLKGAVRAYRKDEEYGENSWERILSAFDTRSSDFGKLIWGDTRFDISFGYAALWTTATRMVTGQKKTISGNVRDIKWGEVLGTFLEGKASPAARLTKDVATYAIATLRGKDAKDFMYQPITWKSLVAEAAPTPIVVENILDLLFNFETLEYSPEVSKEEGAAGILADIFGVSANYYGTAEMDKGKSESLKKVEKILARKENRTPTALKPSKQSSIMKKLSGKTQERAVAEFEKTLNQKLTSLVKSSKFKRMDSEKQAEAMKEVRNQVNSQIKKKYGLK